MQTYPFVSLLLSFVICAACGDGDKVPAVDAPPPPMIDTPIDAAEARGSATITGTVSEQSVAPTTAFYKTHPFVNQKVLVMNRGATCEIAASPGLAVTIGFPCEPTTARAYKLGGPFDPCDPAAPHVWMLVEGLTGEVDELGATTGTATITAIAPNLVGTFNAGFGAKGTLDGSFDAIVCP